VSGPSPTPQSPPPARVEIEYCTRCRFLLRAAWLAQELLSAFEDDLDEVALIPGRGGIFEVRLAGDVLHSRRASGAFPEAKMLKRAVRARVAPQRRLGHEGD